MNRQELQKSIIKSLSWLSNEVSINNKLNLTDINVHSENFYRDLLNLAFDFELININIIDQNATAIDLGDEINSFAIQVTSTSKLDKTKHTVEKFVEKKMYEQYDRLVILNIVEKTAHKALSVGDESYTLDTKKDIWDVGDLAVKFNDFPLEKLQEINQFLNNELYSKPTEALPKNVITILKLIELISDEEHPSIGEGYLEEPFPMEKIYQRFSDHSEFLESEYLVLYQDYGAVLDAVEKGADIGAVKLKRVAQHLRRYSDTVLNECSGNPKAALERIIDHFLNLLQQNGIDADTGAAQFYIIKQLIMCNVFPNKAAISG
ncbi:SMEK domain-containing protein [uncultured Neptuniibacter sp.]|uniref:SMEK domain-containing protein n=1 Tax=uncultured Neptuniibacter sp. TaxID=502143 RepID=UPI002604F735|nr:SMEK domain-containing protein [uncultured Neptuniibacter sp.]